MTSTEFTWYLAGLKDALLPGEAPSAAQWAAIQIALKGVFHKETPERYPVSPGEDPFSALTGGTYCSALLPRATFDWNEGTPKLFVVNHTC